MILWFHYFILVNVFHTCLQFSIYIFNSTVTRLFLYVLCYLISKNLYLLQNAQPFIFQSICMQSCKYINYFLKTQNKQLNQYCLNFPIFFLPKKKVLKKWFGFGSGRVDPQKNTGRVTGQLVFASGQKNRVRVGSGQKILTRFAMSTNNRSSHIKSL